MDRAIILLIACLITYFILTVIGGFLVGIVMIILLIGVGFLLAAIYSAIYKFLRFFEPKKPP